MTVLRARADLTIKRFSNAQIQQTDFQLCYITVYLYCYWDGIRCSWIINSNYKIVFLILEAFTTPNGRTPRCFRLQVY